MQRGIGSIRVTYRGARFVSPAGSGRYPHLLSRGQPRITPRIPSAVRAAAERDPLGAVRRAARSLTPGRPARPATRATLPTRPMRWAASRGELPDPRSWCGRPRSG